MSIILTVGKYGGFYASLGGPRKRVCLGWLAIDLWLCEAEDMHAKMLMLWPEPLWEALTGDGQRRVVWQEEGDGTWRVRIEEAK